MKQLSCFLSYILALIPDLILKFPLQLNFTSKMSLYLARHHHRQMTLLKSTVPLPTDPPISHEHSILFVHLLVCLLLSINKQKQTSTFTLIMRMTRVTVKANTAHYSSFYRFQQQALKYLIIIVMRRLTIIVLLKYWYFWNFRHYWYRKTVIGIVNRQWYFDSLFLII